jgi:serine/threonine protein kinase/tetratricopeptide (TPR) repeat protein
MSNLSHLEAIFFAALEQAPVEREAYLARACANDQLLRCRVEKMLAAQDEARSFLEVGPAACVAELDATCESSHVPASRAIGPYKLLELIGEGGMGLVYMAEQHQPVRRLVALKLIKPGMDSRQVIARFEAERQALAMMDHPHIAKVLDAGTTATNHPYFVMELVRGLPITEFCDQRRLPVRERLWLFVQVCQAVQHAHQKGIIHRDLKPSNVLVTMHDELAVPKIIDFGIVKALGQQLTEQTLHTGFAQLLGTPLYMSPEQAEMSGLDVDTRSDVYSLGVLLYELLTGQTPFDQETLRRAGLNEMRRILQDEEPPRPSHRISTLEAHALSTLSQKRGIDERRWNKLLRGELDWIVMKSLEKDRTRRYESASALAADIQRYLDDEPVEACPPSVVYRMGKVVGRHKVILAAAAMIALALALGTGVSIWQAAAARQAQAEAEAQRKDAEQNVELALAAVDNLLKQLDEGKLPRSPRFDGIRQELIHEVMAFYEKLLAQHGTSPAVRFSTARAWRRIGEVKFEIERYEEAFEAYDKAFVVLEELIARHPTEPKYMSELASANQALASAELHSRDDWDRTRVEKRFRRAIDLRRTLTRLEPQQSDHRFQLLVLEADLDRVQGHRRDEAWHRQRVEAARAITGKDPTNVACRDYLAIAQLEFASHLAGRGAPAAEIDKLFDESAAAFQQLWAEGKSERHYRGKLASVLDAKAMYLESRGDLEQAELYLRQSLEHFDDMYRRLVLGHHDEAFRALVRIQLGQLLEKQGRDAEAEPLYRVAMDDLTHGGWGQRWNAMLHLHSLQMKQGRAAEATASLERLVARLQPQPMTASSDLPTDPVLPIAELMRAEAAGEAEVSMDAAFARLKAPRWKQSDRSADALEKHAWLMTRHSPTPFPRSAVAIAEEAVRLAPHRFEMHRVLGIARYRAKDPIGAVASFRRSLELKPDENITTSLFLAIVLHQQGQIDESRKWQQYAREWIANHEPVSPALKQLEQDFSSMADP